MDDKEHLKEQFQKIWEEKGWSDEGVAEYSKNLYLWPMFLAGVDFGKEAKDEA